MIPGVGNGEKPFFRKYSPIFLDNSKKRICQFFLPPAGEKIFLGLSGLRTFLISFPDSPASTSIAEIFTASLVKSHSGSRNVKGGEGGNEDPH